MISVMETLTELTPRSNWKVAREAGGIIPSWDDILDGKPHRLHRGKDYTLADTTVRQYAYRKARLRGGAAYVAIFENQGTIEIIYYGPETEGYRKILRNRRARELKSLG